jgi:hypothetical protein
VPNEDHIEAIGPCSLVRDDLFELLQTLVQLGGVNNTRRIPLGCLKDKLGHVHVPAMAPCNEQAARRCKRKSTVSHLCLHHAHEHPSTR